MFAKPIGFVYNTHMDTTLHAEVLSLISNREDAIDSILDLCARARLTPPTEAQFADMMTSEVLMYEAQLRSDLEDQYDLEEVWYAERIDEGFDPYMGGYTDDC